MKTLTQPTLHTAPQKITKKQNIQQHVYDRGHLAPTVRAWAARRSIQGTQGRYSPT